MSMDLTTDYKAMFDTEELADTGAYTAPGSDTPVFCKLKIAEGIEMFDGEVPVIAEGFTITFLKSEVSSPKSEGLVEVTTGISAGTYRITHKLASPGSYTIKVGATEE